MPWLILALITPVLVAWKDGSTYGMAFGLTGVGGALSIGNIALIYFYINQRAPSTLADDTWEDTAGKGIVPQWVSALGLVGAGLIVSGLIVAFLLFMGYFVSRS
ncbi:MAG: hypothetical protein AB7L09_12165 [Nitrospira sp.]